MLACRARAVVDHGTVERTPADGAGRRARLPGRLLDQPRLSRKGKGPAARGGEREKRQKPPAFARNRGKTTMIPAVPPHCTPRPAFNFHAAAESFPPPSPSAGDERAKGPVHVCLAGAVDRTPDVCARRRSLFVGKLTVVD